MSDHELPLTLTEAAPIAKVSARTLAHHAERDNLKATKKGKT